MGIEVLMQTPELEYYSDVQRYYKDPNLFVVGRWCNSDDGIGDASGGGVTFRLYYLPQAVNPPYLPDLTGLWLTLNNMYVYTDDSAQKVRVSMPSGFSAFVAGFYSNQFAFTTTLVESPSGDFMMVEAQQYSDWLFKASPINYNRGTITFESNVNTKVYRVSAGGLLLKDKEQMIKEGTWDFLQHKKTEKWFKGVG